MLVQWKKTNVKVRTGHKCSNGLSDVSLMSTPHPYLKVLHHRGRYKTGEESGEE